MAQTPNVCPALHMPLQSGSDRMLRAMRRSYRAERYLGIIDRVRAAMPHAAITTDLIVGFPGETEDDFAATLDVVRQARFANAFTFQYSKRPGTPAAELDGQLPKAVVQERYERLIALQDQIALEENRNQIGRTVELLVATGEGRKDSSTARMSGRARDGRLVHFTPGVQQVRAGDVITTTITRAAPHHLIADGDVISHRRTRAGDAAAQRPPEWGWACRASGSPRRRQSHRDALDEPERAEARRVRRLPRRHRSRRTPYRTRNRAGRTSCGCRHFGVRADRVVHPAAHRRRPRMGCAVLHTGRRQRGSSPAVTRIQLARFGFRCRVFYVGPVDPAVGAGLDRAGGFRGGQRRRFAGGLVATDRVLWTPGSRYRAVRGLDRHHFVDVPLGAGGVVAHDRAACRRRTAPSGRRASAGPNAAGNPRRPDRAEPPEPNGPAQSG